MLQFLLIFPMLFGSGSVEARADQSPTVRLGDVTIVSADHGALVELRADEPECRTSWIVNNDFKNYAIDGQSNSLYVAMPKHDVEVFLVMAPNELDKRIHIRKFRLQYSGDSPPDPEPDDVVPVPVPDNDEVDNEYGVGKLAYSLSRKMSVSLRKKNSEYMDAAAGHLRGNNGVKFIDSEDPRDSDSNVFAWLEQKLSSELQPVVDKMKSLRAKRYSINQWEAVLGEASKGISK